MWKLLMEKTLPLCPNSSGRLPLPFWTSAVLLLILVRWDVYSPVGVVLFCSSSLFFSHFLPIQGVPEATPEALKELSLPAVVLLRRNSTRAAKNGQEF